MQLELTAIAWDLQRLRSTIHGHPIKIYTDNHACCFLLKSSRRELSPQLSRIAVTLFEYNIISIHYVNGKKHNTVADCLSRCLTEEFEDSDVVYEVPLLHIPVLDIAAAQRDDPAIREILENLGNEFYHKLRINFVEKNGILYFRNASSNKNGLVVPESIKPTVLQECHDSFLS